MATVCVCVFVCWSVGRLVVVLLCWLCCCVLCGVCDVCVCVFVCLRVGWLVGLCVCQGTLADSVCDLVHHQYRVSVFLWNPSPARKNDTQIIPTARGRFHAVILQEVVDHVSHITENFYTYTDGNDLVTMLNKDTFVSGPAVSPI